MGKIALFMPEKAFVTGTMLVYVAVISNVLSRIAIAVVVSNFEASDHERKEFNKDRFKAVAEVQFLERRLARCTATVRLSCCMPCNHQIIKTSWQLVPRNV